MKHYLKFTGARKSLIPLGFKFFRYYAASKVRINLKPNIQQSPDLQLAHGITSLPLTSKKVRCFPMI